MYLEALDASTKGYYNLGIEHCIEGYAFHQGLFEQLPQGIYVPILAATQVGRQQSVWIAMSDVSDDLSQYGRAHQRPYQVAEERLRQILSSLARFHVHWESHPQLGELRQGRNLLDISNVMWLYATLYSSALDEAPRYRGTIGQMASPEISARLRAFLDRLPDDVRPMWRSALVDRRSLLQEILTLPQTLLHGDLDDRNVGLRYQDGSQVADGLVLIDWEFCGIGPAGVDVAKLLLQFGGVVDLRNVPSVPFQTLFDEFSAHYVDAYRQWGGTASTDEQILKGIQLGFIKECLVPMPLSFGELIQAKQGSSYDAVHTPGFDQGGVVDGFLDMALAWAAEVVACASRLMRQHL